MRSLLRPGKDTVRANEVQASQSAIPPPSSILASIYSGDDSISSAFQRKLPWESPLAPPARTLAGLAAAASGIQSGQAKLLDKSQSPTKEKKQVKRHKGAQNAPPVSPKSAKRLKPNPKQDGRLDFNLSDEPTKASPNVQDRQYVKYTMSGIQLEFPFQAYPSQIQMMSKMIKALKEKSNALLESPTGSGKSLALLCATLAWQNAERKRLEDQHKADLQQYVQDIKQWNELSLQRKVAEEQQKEDERVKTFHSTSIPPESSQQDNIFMESSINSDEIHTFGDTAQIPESIMKRPFPPRLQRPPIIYYGSRTHRQLAQVIQELRDNTKYRPNMAVLGSRSHYCLNDSARKATDKSLDDTCHALRESNSCKFFNGHLALHQSSHVPDIWDIEDLKRVGKKMKGCPYFAARSFAENANIIFCPYNYLIDPNIRSSLAIDIDDAIIILDEAHNIEDVARDAAACDIDDVALFAIIAELRDLVSRPQVIAEDDSDEKIIDYQLILKFAMAISDFIGDNQCNFQNITFDAKMNTMTASPLLAFLQTREICQSAMNDIKKNLEIINEKTKSSRRDEENPPLSTLALNKLQVMIMAISYAAESAYAQDFRVTITQRIKKKISITLTQYMASSDWNCRFSMWCMNPGIIFNTLKDSHSVILLSGTLSPMASFSSELQAAFPITLEADHIIPLEATWVGVIPRVEASEGAVELRGVYRETETLAYQDALGNAIVAILKRVPHGVLVFGPSYAFLDKMMTRWRATGALANMEEFKRVFIEPRGSSSHDGNSMDVAIKEYYDEIQQSVNDEQNGILSKGAVMFGVFRGKISEGIDFADERARAVICIGIPYPSTKDPIVACKKTYNDNFCTSRGLLSGSAWYDIQAYRAINQALGRCIRHKKDWGALILLDSRFMWPKHQSGISKWVRPRLRIMNGLNNACQELESWLNSRKQSFPSKS